MMVKYHIEIMKGEETANFYYDSTSQIENSDSCEGNGVAVATGHNGGFERTSGTTNTMNVTGLSEDDKLAREQQFMIDSWVKLNDKYAYAQLMQDIVQELNCTR